MTDALPHGLIAHRGASAVAPENTLPAVAAARQAGVAWVELDLRLSADGQVMVIHDATVERTTDGHGRVAGQSAADLARLDAGAWFDSRFAGTRIPTLADMAAALGRLGLGAVLELKPDPGNGPALARAAVATLGRHWPGGIPRPLLSSFDDATLAAARAAAPDLPRALILDTPGAWQSRCQALAPAMLHVRAEGIDDRLLARARDQGLAVAAWTVDTPDARAGLIARGCAAIFTNRP